MKKLILFLAASIGFVILSGCANQLADVPYPSTGTEPIPSPWTIAEPDLQETEIYQEYQKTGPVMNRETFLAALAAQGIMFEDAGEDASATWLSVGARHISIGEELIAIYEYASSEALEADAAGIDQSGFSISRSDPDNPEYQIITGVSWVSWPFWFRADVIIVRYVGENQQIIDAIRHILGEPFAGGIIPAADEKQQIELGLSLADDDILQNYGDMAVCTYELNICATYFEAIVDFLIDSYSEIFMRTLVSEDTDGGRAGFRHGSWGMFDFYCGSPVISVTFHDAGSRTGPAHYIFVDGKYQRTMDLPLDILSGDSPTLTRGLGGDFRRQITDAVTQRLWPMLILRDDGIVVDGNLSNVAVDEIINFVAELRYMHTVDVIKASLLQDNLISVMTTCESGFQRYLWVTLHIVDGGYEVYSYCEEYLWWGN